MAHHEIGGGEGGKIIHIYCEVCGARAGGGPRDGEQFFIVSGYKVLVVINQ